jgi:hypothetical protein
MHSEELQKRIKAEVAKRKKINKAFVVEEQGKDVVRAAMGRGKTPIDPSLQRSSAGSPIQVQETAAKSPSQSNPEVSAPTNASTTQNYDNVDGGGVVDAAAAAFGLGEKRPSQHGGDAFHEEDDDLPIRRGTRIVAGGGIGDSDYAWRISPPTTIGNDSRRESMASTTSMTGGGGRVVASSAPVFVPPDDPDVFDDPNDLVEAAQSLHDYQ